MQRKQLWIIGLLNLVLLTMCVTLGVYTIREIPGRYAYYLPEPLQQLRHNPHPETLPTAPAIHTTAPTPFPTAAPTGQPVQPTATTLPTATPTQPFVPTVTAAPISFTLAGLQHEHQGWNNCGPTTLAMALSYWEIPETQHDIAPTLKPDPEDKNVSLSEMEAYARDVGLGAIVRVAGTTDRLKALVRAGFPVIVETWYVRDAADQLGHYRLIIGYDDAARQFLTYDSLHGPNVRIDYQELDELWRVFNRMYLVIYTPERWDELAAVLGSHLNDVEMYEHALQIARVEAENPPPDCVAYADRGDGKCADWVTFAWFNIGTNLTSLGRHSEAVSAYDQARARGLHWRMLWYQFGPYESYYAVGRYADVIALADTTLQTADNLEESYYWRGKAYLAQGNTTKARRDFETALRYHEGWTPALEALASIE